MKLGLRPQILLLLGGSMLLAFLPLFFAVSTYTRAALEQVREAHAKNLGRAIAGHVLEAQVKRGHQQLMALLRSEVQTEAVAAIAVYDESGQAIARVGVPEQVALLAGERRTSQHSVFPVVGQHLGVFVPGQAGSVAVILRTDDHAGTTEPLLRLVALYTGLFALGLLILVYFALTRLIVRPVDDLSRTAQRVAAGGRRFEIPHSGARELAELSRSLKAMTERLMREEEALRQKVDEVEQATEKLRQAQHGLIRSERLASVGRLAAGLAHEIGNPIAALLGLVDLLLDGDLEQAQTRDFLHRMRREAERISRILRDLLQFSRSSKTERGTRTPGDLQAAIYDTATLVDPQKVMHDVELALDVEPDLKKVPLEQEQLVQVILNLVLNAADACEKNGRIFIRARSSGTKVRLEVQDNGPGVDEDVRQRLFEPFVTTKETGKGTGLGLAVCRGLVESAGGAIWLDEDYTDGARFVVELSALKP